MAVLLTILKVIGIILLVILGLVLLIILLVLFSPISYRITANHNDNDTRAKVRIGFLIINGFGQFIKGEGLDYAVKLLFFKVYPREKKEDIAEKEDYMSVDLPDEEELQEFENASNVSANIAFLFLPPVDSSPFPNLKYFPNPNFLEYSYNAFSHT